MTDLGSITLTREGLVAVLTLDRPAKRNALTPVMVAEFDRLSAELQADAGVRAVVLTGAGDRAFCAGGDLAELIPTALAARADTLNPDPTKRFLSTLYKPIVAAVRGACFGAGFELLLGTDIRVAGTDARFGLPEASLGLIPGGGTHVRLPWQLPMAIAKSMLLLGETLDAVRAEHFGLVNEVVDPDLVLQRALELATRIAANGPVAVQTSKELVSRFTEPTSAFLLEHALNARVLGSEDAAEGVTSFREKRPPVYQGR